MLHLTCSSYAVILSVRLDFVSKAALSGPTNFRNGTAERSVTGQCIKGVPVISAILDFRGPIMFFLKSPCTTSYRSSIETIALNCLVFE